MSKTRYVIHSTCFDKRGRVVSSATNSYVDSVALMRYYAVKSGNPHKVFNHSEIAAIDKALKARKDIHRLVIIRYDSQGRLKDSKPCPVCSYAIEDIGIKEVYYSTPEGMKKL